MRLRYVGRRSRTDVASRMSELTMRMSCVEKEVSLSTCNRVSTSIRESFIPAAGEFPFRDSRLLVDATP